MQTVYTQKTIEGFQGLGSDLSYMKNFDIDDGLRLTESHDSHYFLISAKWFAIIYKNLDLPLSAVTSKKVELYSKLEDSAKFMNNLHDNRFKMEFEFINNILLFENINNNIIKVY